MPRRCIACEADISGRDWQAKYCSRSCSQKAYLKNNKSRVKKLRADSYQRNKEHHQARYRERYDSLKDEISLKGKQTRAAARGIDLNNRRCIVCQRDISHRNLKAEYCQPCYAAHEKERAKELKAVSYQRNKEHIRAKGKEWYEAHKEEISQKEKLARAASKGIDPNSRGCVVCGQDISHRNLKAQYCEPCYEMHEQESNRARANRHYADHRDQKKEQAREYGKSPRGRAMRRAWIRRNPSYMREYQRRAYREKVGYDPNGRTCADCGTDISHRGHRAIFCKLCAEQRRAKLVRTCAVCGVDISLRGPRATFCSRVCLLRLRRQNRQREYAAQTREWRESRTCALCGVGIADQSSSAKYCRECSERRKENALRGVHRRRARKLGQLGTVSPNITAILLELQNRRCAAPWCWLRIAKNAPKRGRWIRKFELDHIVPLALGGMDDDKNFQLLCYPCHRGKGKKKPDVWYMQHRHLGIALSPIVANGRVSLAPTVDEVAVG